MATDPHDVSGPRFSFRSSWRVPSPPDRVHAVLEDIAGYPSWWPQVVAVARVDEDRARVLCRSALPLTLDLLLTAVHRERLLLETRVEGDLLGEVRWRLRPEAGGTRLEFEQDVVVAARGLALASYAARPLLGWNHDRMLAGCRAGLARRLDS